MQPPSRLFLEPIIQALREIFSVPDLLHREYLIGVFLLGSTTTDEMCKRFGTSDIDLLLIMQEGIDDDVCFMIKTDVRRRFIGCAFGMVSLGLRCRYVSELGVFSRYLALQGYHMSFAVSIFSKDANQVTLPDFERHPATEAEFLCIFGECLWGEIRARAQSERMDKISAYLESKVLLSYLNLLLVANGVFLPTHRERANHWLNSKHEIAFDANIDAVVDVKSGKNATIDMEKLHEMINTLRVFCFNRLGAAFNFVNSEENIDSAMFWLSDEITLSSTDRVNVVREICTSLFHILSGVRAGQQKNHDNQDDHIRMPYFTDALINKSWSDISRYIHSHRIMRSRASQRDWGNTMHSEQVF